MNGLGGTPGGIRTHDLRLRRLQATAAHRSRPRKTGVGCPAKWPFVADGGRLSGTACKSLQGPSSTNELLLREQNVCPHCDITLPALTAALFSFNAPSGMCPDCNGLGNKMQVDPGLIVDINLDAVLQFPEVGDASGAKHSESAGSLRIAIDLLA